MSEHSPERRKARTLRHALSVAINSQPQPDPLILLEIRRELAVMRQTNPRGWGERDATALLERVDALEGHATRIWRGLENLGAMMDRLRGPKGSDEK